MDIKKLMHILLRDIKDLENFVGELKQTAEFDRMDRELMLTKISGIRYLLEVAAGEEEHPSGTFRTVQRIQDNVAPDKKTEQLSRPARQENHTVIPVREEKIIPAIQTKVEKQDTHSEKSLQDADFQLHDEIGSQEKKESHPEKQILGEKFIAGKSVNDLLLEKSKSDSRFSHLPLSNLGNSITTNDKFLFIRELFDGNADDYNETIRKIDSMDSIQEAAAFLRDHCGWKKSETSLKFIDLVKRRFIRQ
jgi:hypothetical protein